MSLNIPHGKLNRWCERRGLNISDKVKMEQASKILRDRTLSINEQAILYIHDLFGCEGIEFVVFSSARFDKTVSFSGNITLVPCYLPNEKMKSWKDPLVRLTFTMMNYARFIYDGWVPITDWTIENVRNVIRDIDRIFSLFAAQERIWFTWEPKYFPSQLYPSSHEITDNHIQEINDLVQDVQTWKKEDKDAFYRSLAWLSQSLILSQPVARFFFGIISIESFATYVEKDATNDSVFNGLKTTYPNTTQDKFECIEKMLGDLHSDNLIKAVEQAYFNCIIPITRMLKKHLKNIFTDEIEYYEIMFESDEDESLYELRHKIAHGGFDALNDIERQKIATRIWDVERTARKYFHNVLKIVLGKSAFTHIMTKSMSIPMVNAISSHEGMYKGPIHMAEFYTYVKR